MAALARFPLYKKSKGQMKVLRLKKCILRIWFLAIFAIPFPMLNAFVRVGHITTLSVFSFYISFTHAWKIAAN